MDRVRNVEDLVQRLSNLEHKSNKKVPTSSLTNVDKSIIHRSLVFKVIADLEVRKGAARQLKNPVDIREYGDGTFLATFANERDERKIMTTGPWSFRGDLIAMQRCIPEKAASQYSFSDIEIWVQINGIPLEYMNADCITSIVSSFSVVCSDLDDSLQKWGSYIRVKVSMPISSVLVSSIGFPLLTNPDYKLSIKYEKLRRFCKFCWCIGHERKSCDLLKELENCLCSDDLSHVEGELLKKLKGDRLSDDVRALSHSKKRPQPKFEDTFSKSKNKCFGDVSSSSQEPPQHRTPSFDIQNQHHEHTRLTSCKFTAGLGPHVGVGPSLMTKITPKLLNIIAPKSLGPDTNLFECHVPSSSPGLQKRGNVSKSNMECSPTLFDKDAPYLAANNMQHMGEGFVPGLEISKSSTSPLKKQLRRKKSSTHSNKFIVGSPRTPMSRKRSLSTAACTSPLYKPKRLRKVHVVDVSEESPKVRRNLDIDGGADFCSSYGDDVLSSAVVAMQPRQTS